MIPSLAARVTLNPLGHTSGQPLHLNADYAHHLGTQTPVLNDNDPLILRLLPAFLRAPLSKRLAARREEALLIATWQNSPHLLADMGFVLTRNADLPDHLIAAPAAVIDHVASHAPEQIVAAELQFPPRPAAKTPAAKTPAPRTQDTLRLEPRMSPVRA